MQVVRPTPTAVYTGITHAVSRIASTEGALTMWRGMTSVIMGAGMLFSVVLIQVLHMQCILQHMKYANNA